MRDNEKDFVPLQKNNINNSGLIMPANKTRIRELRNWAKENLAQKIVMHDVFGRPITFSMGGIKEYLNQPHKHYQEKNELIKNITNVIKASQYRGETNYNGRISHIFEIELLGDKSWIIANEVKGKGVLFYSISDSEKVLTDIKNVAQTGY
jgi:hypothetical protein